MVQKKLSISIIIGLLVFGTVGAYLILKRDHSPLLDADAVALDSTGYAGTSSCRECHEKFYRLWAPSNHGLAMQAFTPELFKSRLSDQEEDIEISDKRYRAEFDGEKGWIRENGTVEKKKYPIAYAMGGKNVYYFLTPMQRGRLQVLPLAYDVRKKNWFDMAASGIRHFRDIEEETIDWKDLEYTFNTSCYNCHVSQYTANYNLENDTYNTTWREPGINCETCHGSAVEHVRVCREAGEGRTPEDLKIETITPPKYSPEVSSEACASCHAKGSPLSSSFPPGDRFFDHFDLVTFESPDYYPDGRDLGENYTYTQWRRSPCIRSGRLDCLHCHTSSGRYRFQGEESNRACLPCHAERVENASEHTRHPEGSAGNLCVSCHMPMTDFARMNRSDHSMLPPTPAATIAFESPNACNICHQDKDAAWADRWVRQWRSRDFQAPVLQRAALIASARRRDWSDLPAMLEYLTDKNQDEIYVVSLIRLLRNCEDERRWPAFIQALAHTSPLVRAAAAEALGERLDDSTIALLLAATRDEYRLVRIRAAAALAPVPMGTLGGENRESLAKAVAELKDSLNALPDQWWSHYNLGNFYMARREYGDAAASYETAIRLRPTDVSPYVNASMAYNMLKQNGKAEQHLRRAIEIDPDNYAANLNLGLLLGELGRPLEAEAYFQAASGINPESPVAAYNLGIILAQSDRAAKAFDYLRRAYKLRPAEPKYGFTLAYYLRQDGRTVEAIRMLEEVIKKRESAMDAYLLLGEIYREEGRIRDAIAVYRDALKNTNPPVAQRQQLESMISDLQQR